MTNYTQAEIQQGKATMKEMRKDEITEYCINGFCVLLLIAAFVGACIL